MLRRKVLVLVAAMVVVAAGVAGVAAAWPREDYTLKLVMPSAAGLYAGSQVQVDGQPAGKVTALSTQDGEAVATIALDRAYAPVHAGTQPKITFRSVLGENYVELVPGPAANTLLPSGALIQSGWSEVTVENLLEALDPDTRAHLNSLVQQLQGTLSGKEKDVNATITAAGPAVQALGQVLDAVGADGPAIRELITNLHDVTSTLASRRDQLSSTVRNVEDLTTAAAGQQQQLSDALHELPSTLGSAKGALDAVPSAVDAATPLLRDLAPAAARLSTVSKNLSPLLTDLRPAIAQLRPTLASASSLLQETPGLLDAVHAVLPDVTRTLGGLGPALTFLRPYTPDLMGFLSNWGSAFSNYDSQGHYGRALAMVSASYVNNSPLPDLPTMSVDHSPAPGVAAHQPWTDANGDGIR